MVFVHAPFQPTPDSKDWNAESSGKIDDTKYFKDMVEYTDKVIDRICDKLAELELDDNTLLIFVGDNGTGRAITTNTKHGPIRGGKGLTTDAGTHVPLIMYWPDKIKEGVVYDDMIVFSDFLTSFADLTGSGIKSDGLSFLPLLQGDDYRPREIAFIHYNARPDTNPGDASQFAKTKEYKLYRNGAFYNLTNDILEKSPLEDKQLSNEEKIIKSKLQDELKLHPGKN